MCVCSKEEFFTDCNILTVMSQMMNIFVIVQLGLIKADASTDS